MPSLKLFSQYESAVKTVNFNITPYSLSFDQITVQIDVENSNYVISANTELTVNNAKCFITPVKTGDLIYFDNRFLVFSGQSSASHQHLFLGKARISDNKILVFKLPQKISQGAFNDIQKITAKYADIKEIYVDSSCIHYMDSKSITSMMALIRELKQKNIHIRFYRPDNKFKSYLKLANIEKLIPVKESAYPALDAFIEKKSAENIPRSENRYIITDKVSNYIVPSETVISIGRSKDICDIYLPDESISRTHALLLNISNFLYAIDCHSGNYSYINGWAIFPYCLHQLKVNDIIAFGRKYYFNVKQL